MEDIKKEIEKFEELMKGLQKTQEEIDDLIR